MAGTAAERELRAAAKFAEATRADEAGLRTILRATPTPGAISLRFEREPGYFDGENVADARDTTIVARVDDRIVCMGRCSRRELYVGGVRRTVGYLGELRLAPGTPRGPAILREGYAHFARMEAGDPADLYYTSVAGTNLRARAVLERGRLGLPHYEPLAELATVAWPVPRRGVTDIVAMGGGEELTSFLDTQARRYALTSSWGTDTWAVLKRHGLSESDFCVVRRGGRIVAAAGVWDQAAWRQTVVAGYSGAAGRLRPLINGLSRVAGRPGLPATGERLRQACVHPLAMAEAATASDFGALADGLERIARRKGVEWLVATVDARDFWREALRRCRGAREYATRLSLVRLHGLEGPADNLSAQWTRPEAGLL